MIPGEFHLNFLAGNLENKYVTAEAEEHRGSGCEEGWGLAHTSLMGVRIDLFPSVASYKEEKKTVKETQVH